MPPDAADSELTAIPNVGRAVAGKPRALDITSADDLRRRDAEERFERVCARDGRRRDPCLLDTFVAAVDWADGAPRNRGGSTRARKARGG